MAAVAAVGRCDALNKLGPPTLIHGSPDTEEGTGGMEAGWPDVPACAEGIWLLLMTCLPACLPKMVSEMTGGVAAGQAGAEAGQLARAVGTADAACGAAGNVGATVPTLLTGALLSGK